LHQEDSVCNYHSGDHLEKGVAMERFNRITLVLALLSTVFANNTMQGMDDNENDDEMLKKKVHLDEKSDHDVHHKEHHHSKHQYSLKKTDLKKQLKKSEEGVLLLASLSVEKDNELKLCTEELKQKTAQLDILQAQINSTNQTSSNMTNQYDLINNQLQNALKVKAYLSVCCAFLAALTAGSYFYIWFKNVEDQQEQESLEIDDQTESDGDQVVVLENDTLPSEQVIISIAAVTVTDVVEMLPKEELLQESADQTKVNEEPVLQNLQEQITDAPILNELADNGATIDQQIDEAHAPEMAI